MEKEIEGIIPAVVTLFDSSENVEINSASL